MIVHVHPYAVMAVGGTKAGLLPLSQAAFFLWKQVSREEYDFRSAVSTREDPMRTPCVSVRLATCDLATSANSTFHMPQVYARAHTQSHAHTRARTRAHILDALSRGRPQCSAPSGAATRRPSSRPSLSASRMVRPPLRPPVGARWEPTERGLCCASATTPPFSTAPRGTVGPPPPPPHSALGVRADRFILFILWRCRRQARDDPEPPRHVRGRAGRRRGSLRRHPPHAGSALAGERCSAQ